MGPIPYRDIKAEARDLELDDDTAEIFIHTISALDAVFLEWCEQERKNNEKK